MKKYMLHLSTQAKPGGDERQGGKAALTFIYITEFNSNNPMKPILILKVEIHSETNVT